MWGDILLSIGTSVSESLCAKYIDEKNRNAFHQKLKQTIYNLFQNFADTSLDKDEFASFIRSSAFVEMLQRYFFSLDNTENKESYLTAFVDDICKRCPSVNNLEARDFIKKLEEMYDSFLKQEIDDDPTLSALYQLLLKSQKSFLKKVLSSQEELKKYFASIDGRSVQITDEDIQRYHDICSSEFGVVRFTGISGVEGKNSQDINEFYVENSFSYSNPFNHPDIFSDKSDGAPCGLGQLFASSNKIVMIGGAGLGKSTSLNYLFCNYEKLYGSFALKLKIDLKDYAGDIAEKHHDILWCLSKEFHKRIPQSKLTFNDTPQLLAEYLAAGKCLIIFDALDEIPSQHKRNKVRDEISTFCDVNYLNRFIISSREVGYLKNRFEQDFVHFRINEFDMEQIQAYSRNWLKVTHRNQDFHEFWGKFEIELDRAKCQTLVKNPIILILALVIFDTGKSLPNRRVEFYKRCVDTFLTTRETHTKPFEYGDKFKDILNDNSIIPKVAHYKYEKIDEDIDYCFTRVELNEAIMEAIEVSDRRPWFDAVSQFAQYLIDRTELIREKDEDSLDFAHKTFYEYFLASYYVQEKSVEELCDLLKSWIGDANNDEMARLIIEVVVEKNDAGQHRAVMDFLFKRIRNTLMGMNVFSIVAELYACNMLQPKYHDRYYRCILLYPRATGRLVRRRPDDLRYDAPRVAELFLEYVDQDFACFYRMLPALWNLSPEFKNHLIQLGEERNEKLYQKAIALLEYRTVEKVLALSDQTKRELFEYFTIERSDIALQSPEIYITLLLMAVGGDLEQPSKLFGFQFEPESVFWSFLPVSASHYLLNLCFHSAENMLLFLIAIIHCAKNNTDSLLERACRHMYLHAVVIELWGNLFDEPDFERWVQWLTEQSLYMPEYEELYQRLFVEYSSNIMELGHAHWHLKEFINTKDIR